VENHKLLVTSPIICTISVLAWELKVKGIEILIKAFREIIDQYPEGKLLIVGDGPRKHNLQILAESLKLENNVIFCGYMDNPFVALSVSDIYCHISLQEAFGQAILEAMICGKPVVAARIGGIAEIITSEENGILVEPDEKSVAEALLYLITNPILARRLGTNAETLVCEKFLWPDIAEQIFNLYQTL
jgi:glycosyltransferase involved in cell wall biosynthesis